MESQYMDFKVTSFTTYMRQLINIIGDFGLGCGFPGFPGNWLLMEKIKPKYGGNVEDNRTFISDDLVSLRPLSTELVISR